MKRESKKQKRPTVGHLNLRLKGEPVYRYSFEYDIKNTGEALTYFVNDFDDEIRNWYRTQETYDYADLDSLEIDLSVSCKGEGEIVLLRATEDYLDSLVDYIRDDTL